MGKHVFWLTFAAVVVGIYIFSKAKKAPDGTITFGPISIKPTESAVFNGPDVDPVTGAYLPAGAQAGTSNFPIQPIA